MKVGYNNHLGTEENTGMSSSKHSLQNVLSAFPKNVITDDSLPCYYGMKF